MTNFKKIMSTREAASYLGIKQKTLAVWRCNARYKIPYIKIGRLVKYRKEDLDNWLTTCTK